MTATKNKIYKLMKYKRKKKLLKRKQLYFYSNSYQDTYLERRTMELSSLQISHPTNKYECTEIQQRNLINANRI